MTKVLVVHGAGMNMRGKVQVDVFGHMTLDGYDARIRDYAKALGISVETFHSNIEGEVINRIYAAGEQDFGGALINPAGYMTGYPALCLAISQVAYPTIEVHISNPARRGLVSDVGKVCRATIAGFGISGYDLALRALQDMLSKA